MEGFDDKPGKEDSRGRGAEAVVMRKMKYCLWVVSESEEQNSRDTETKAGVDGVSRSPVQMGKHEGSCVTCGKGGRSKRTAELMPARWRDDRRELWIR